MDTSTIEAPIRICIIGTLGQDPSILNTAKSFGVTSIVTSDSGDQFISDETHVTYFVINEFRGACFDKLCQMKCRILGPTALRELAENHESLPPLDRFRPIYSYSMRGLVVCFTGFMKKKELCRLAKLLHLMGGSIREEMGCKITHLVAYFPCGQKYQYALTFNIPVMAASWVTTAWENRHIVGYSCKNSNVISEHKLKFGNARVCFLGFSAEETEHMTEVLISNKGVISSFNDPQCTHLVVDESTILTLPENTPSKACIVKAEWFWVSVQNEACADEKEYLFEDVTETVFSPNRSRYQSTPMSFNAFAKVRKRKRLEEKAPLNQFESPSTRKRRSSISDAGLLSVSNSYLDCTAEKELSDEIEDSSETGHFSARRQVFLELVQTESNYVNILKTIISLFKTPLEEMTEGENMLLNATEVKIIFGNLPPIYDIHSNMLEELKWGVQNWKDFSIGRVILKYAPEMEKMYPAFINYFEKSKETLEQCDMTKPRFHAFLKIRQTKPECGRQSLKELLIRPVQRLPSISLLLNDLLKNTGKSNLDRSALERALICTKQVMTHINEDKRKTEAQLAMFDLFNEIENCPAHLVSSHRSLVAKCECVELTEILSSKKGDGLIFLLFTDTLEVCKKRAKTFNSFRNTKPSSLQKISKFRKQYKHIRLMPLSNIRKVIDVKESEDCQNVFALMCRNNKTAKDDLCSFVVTEESVKKRAFLKEICKQMAHTVCTPDPDDFYDVMEPNEVNIRTSSNVSLRPVHSFSKALRFASKTGVKVGRALSMNKAPSTNNTPSRMTRAVSAIRPFTDQGTLTPNSSQFAQMRLQSRSHLNLSSSYSSYESFF